MPFVHDFIAVGYSRVIPHSPRKPDACWSSITGSGRARCWDRTTVQRKVLRPNTAESLFELEDTILAFQERYQQRATPFAWKYMRQELAKLMARLKPDAAQLALSA